MLSRKCVHVCVFEYNEINTQHSDMQATHHSFKCVICMDAKRCTTTGIKLHDTIQQIGGGGVTIPRMGHMGS